MKLKGILLTSALTAMLGVGVFAGVSGNKGAATVEKVEAGTHTQNPTIYFVPHDQWTTLDNERFWVECFDSGTSKVKEEMEFYGESNVPGFFYNRKVYKYVVSNDSWINQVKFYRVSSSGDIDHPFNTSGNVTLNNDNDCPVIMTNHDLDYWNNWTEGTPGVWKTTLTGHKGVVHSTDYVPSASTGRVFFYNSGTHWASANGCAVYAWGGDATKNIWNDHSEQYDATIYNLKWFTDDNSHMYGYADIPTNVTGYKICTVTDVDSDVTGTGYFSNTEFIPDSFAWVRYGKANGDDIDSGAAQNNTGATLMEKVLEAYSTCSSSVLNGYGAYSALNTNFYSKATDAAKNTKVKTLGIGKSSLSMTVTEHFEAMAYRSEHGLSGSIVTFESVKAANSTTTISVLISIVAVGAIAGFLFLKKKKNF